MKPRLISDASGILFRATELVSQIFRGLPRMRLAVTCFFRKTGGLARTGGQLLIADS
jgi:hypothetical protein